MTKILNNIHTLAIESMPISKHAASGLLVSLTSLTSIIIGNHPSDQTRMFERLLTNPHDDDYKGLEMYCPMLNTVYWKHVTQFQLKSFVFARHFHGLPLTNVHVSSDTTLSDKCRKYIHKRGCTIHEHELLHHIR